MDEYSAHLSFSLSPIGPKTFQNLISIYGFASNAWNKNSSQKYKEAGIGEKVYVKFENFKTEFDLDEYLKKLKNTKVEFVPQVDKYYPKSLYVLADPPIGLFIRGNKKLLLDKKTIGVVGTRRMTSYGASVTEDIVSGLAQNGITIISGMALGVDASAHAAAILPHGATIAVLGCGVDCPYPRENERLYQDIIDNNGLVISEYPLGTAANKGTFPARNRIIAALSRGILVTEAGENSGSLITAGLAITQNKPVFAVPGQITSQVARGTIKLLRDGAIMVTSSDDVLSEFKMKNKSQNKQIDLKKLSATEQKIIKSIENEAKTISQIAKETKIEVSILSISLSEMELMGYIKNTLGKISSNV